MSGFKNSDLVAAAAQRRDSEAGPRATADRYIRREPQRPIADENNAAENLTFRGARILANEEQEKAKQ